MDEIDSRRDRGPGRMRRPIHRWAQLGLAVGTALALIAACAPAPASPRAAPSQPASAAAPAPAAAAAPEKVTFTLNYILYGGHAPYLLAQERGYFAEQGLDVSIVEGKGSASTAQVVGAGTSQVGEIDGSVVIRSVAQDIPIKAVAGLIQKSPISAMVGRTAGIAGPKDLQGKKIGAPPASVATVLLPTWLRMNGVDPETVQLISVGPETLNSTLLLGQVDGIVAFDENVIKINAAGGDVFAIHYADYGLNLPSTTIAANTAFLREKPDVMRRFLAATLKGWGEAAQDPKTAVNALMKSAPPTLRAESETAILANLMTLLHSKRTEGQRLGWMAAEDWEEAVAILAEQGDLPSKPAVADLITNEFLPAN
jgi:NitT/TauT family transport system substrate-binding protein